jgi:hypothetical protein
MRVCTRERADRGLASALLVVVRGHVTSALTAQTHEAAEAALAEAGRRLDEAAGFAKGDPAVLVAAGEALVARAELRVAAAAEAAAGAGRARRSLLSGRGCPCTSWPLSDLLHSARLQSTLWLLQLFSLICLKVGYVWGGDA